jgi:hypothetical protein
MVEVIGVNGISIARDGHVLSGVEKILIHLKLDLLELEVDPRVLFITQVVSRSNNSTECIECADNDCVNKTQYAFVANEVSFNFRTCGYRLVGSGKDAKFSYNDQVLPHVQSLQITFDEKEVIARVDLQLDLPLLSDQVSAKTSEPIFKV